ncbi:MAG: hypothetical protein GC160_03000 [Acidobacteria bacterium]|nr:hypothetical protein [Acidobacteriota bacterium]
MARTLSTAIAAAAASGRAMLVHALYLSLGGVDYFYAERAITFESQAYQVGLRWSEDLTLRRSLAADTVQVEVENVSLGLAQILRQQYVMGDYGELRRLWLGAGSQIVFAGRVGAVEVDRNSARLTLRSHIDPQAQLPIRTPGAKCPWRFKGTACGYVGVGDECDKTTDACIAYSNIHRFGGFPTLTRELAETVAPAPVAEPIAPERDFLSDYYGEEATW